MQTAKLIFIRKAIPAFILLISIYTVLPYPPKGFEIISYIDSTVFWWLINSIILVVLYFSLNKVFEYKQKKNYYFVTLYVIWNVFSIIRGMFVAENYWDWKAWFNNSTGLLLIIIAYYATNKYIIQDIFRYYVKFVFPLFTIIIFIIYPGAYGFFLVPISIISLFVPVLRNKWRIIIILATLFVIFADLSARSNVIKFVVPLLISFIIYFKKVLPTKLLETLRLSLIVTPILLFLYGVLGAFNVFKMDEYINSDVSVTTQDYYGNRTKNDLKADSRTFIYEEVISSAINNNYWIWGRTPARGNDTAFFVELKNTYGRAERWYNEIGITNVFTWTGIIGVILYFLVFYYASYLSINKSKNIYSKILGLYLAFRWLYAWIEDINIFSLTTYILWIVIGMCISESFRSMSDFEVKVWVRGIFDSRYRILNKTSNTNAKE